MEVEDLTNDQVALLRLIKERGSSVCTGACENRLPGELHCLNASQMLHISAQGFKNRLLRLVRMGLLDLQRVKRADGKVMGQYTVSEEGIEALSKSA
jgi:predicted ArsR family transcriptional regulator